MQFMRVRISADGVTASPMGPIVPGLVRGGALLGGRDGLYGLAFFAPAGTPPDRGYMVHIMRSEDGGNTWLPPGMIAGTLTERPNSLRAAVADSMEQHLVWTQERKTLRHLVSRDLGQTWSPPAVVLEQEGIFDLRLSAGPCSHLYLGYIQERPPKGDLSRFLRYTDTGWEELAVKPLQHAPAGGNEISIDVAPFLTRALDGRIHIAWSTMSVTDRKRVLAKTRRAIMTRTGC
jgi:hypothetical protein